MFFVWIQTGLVVGAALLAWRLVAALHLRGRARALAWGALAGVVAVAIAGPAVWRATGRDVSEPQRLLFVSYAAMGFLAIAVVATLAKDAALLAHRLLDALRARAAKRGVDLERRRLLARSLTMGAAGASAALGGAGLVVATKRPDLVDVDVPIAGLPASLEGFTIAQISDVHVGPTIRASFVESVVDVVNEARADLVAVTGDIVDGRVEQLRAQTAPPARLQARHGAFFVTGNHEYHSDAGPWIAEMRRLGMRVLENGHHLVEHGGGRLLVAGVNDLRAGRRDPQAACDPAACLVGAPAHDVKILLAHQPVTIHKARGLGFHLQLSGHTHGGQFFPFNFLIHFAQPLVAGLYDVDGTQVYVNRGTGYWGPPLRLGPTSEVTRITLRRA